MKYYGVKLIFGYWFLIYSLVQSQTTNVENSTSSPVIISTGSMSVTSADTTSVTGIIQTQTNSSVITITSSPNTTTSSNSTLTLNNLTNSSYEVTTQSFLMKTSNLIQSTPEQSSSNSTFSIGSSNFVTPATIQSSSNLTSTSMPLSFSSTDNNVKTSNLIQSTPEQSSSNSTFSIASSNFITSSSIQHSSNLTSISTPFPFSSTNNNVSSTIISDIKTSMLPTSTLASSTVISVGSSSQGLSSSNTTQGISSTITLTATTLSTDQITSPYWVVTVCNISTSTDVTTSTFKNDMELRLSNAYAVALSASQTSGRRKRAVTNGTNTLQLVSATRITATQTPTNLVYYIVGSSNTYISPSTVISIMNQLNTQQMSIILNAIVTTVATYYNSATQNPGTDQKLWIIGAVFGSLAGVALIIWLVFFIYSRCIRPWDEPLLLKESEDLERNDSFSDDQIKVLNITDENRNFPKVMSLNIEEHLNEEMNSKLDKNYNQNLKESTENKQIGNELVIKHVYESRPRKYHKRHSSSSSSSSSSDSKKKKKSSKEAKITFDSSNNDTNVINEKQKVKKKSKIKQQSIKKKKKPQISDIIVSTTLGMEMMASNTTLNTNLTKENNSDLTPIEEKYAEILKYKDQLTNIEDDRSIESEQPLQSPRSSENKININLIEVQPKSLPQNDINSFELVEPVPFMNNYGPQHIFPNYSTEIYAISDTSLNLVEIKETDKLESQRSEMKSKQNLRTFEPLPRKNVQKINYDISTDDLIASLNKEMNEVKQYNSKTD